MSPTTTTTPLDADCLAELTEDLEEVVARFGVDLPESVLTALTNHVADVITAAGGTSTQRYLISNHAKVTIAAIEASPTRRGNIESWTAIADQDGILSPYLSVTYAHGAVYLVDVDDNAPAVQALRDISALLGPLEPGHRHTLALSS